MDLSLTEEQQHLREAVSRFLAKAAAPERVREVEPTGFDPDTWAGLVDMGVVTMGLPEAVGGAGAGLADIAVVAELAGAHIAPVPYVEAVVALRLLARAAVLPAIVVGLGLWVLLAILDAPVLGFISGLAVGLWALFSSIALLIGAFIGGAISPVRDNIIQPPR